MAKDTNRKAMKIATKQFDLVSQFTNDEDIVKKFVAQHAKKHGQSLIGNIRAHVADPDRHTRFKRELVTVQRIYSKAKRDARRRKSQEEFKVVQGTINR